MVKAGNLVLLAFVVASVVVASGKRIPSNCKKSAKVTKNKCKVFRGPIKQGYKCGASQACEFGFGMIVRRKHGRVKSQSYRDRDENMLAAAKYFDKKLPLTKKTRRLGRGGDSSTTYRVLATDTTVGKPAGCKRSKKVDKSVCIPAFGKGRATGYECGKGKAAKVGCKWVYTVSKVAKQRTYYHGRKKGFAGARKISGSNKSKIIARRHWFEGSGKKRTLWFRITLFTLKV